MDVDTIVDKLNHQLALYGPHRLEAVTSSGTERKGTIRGDLGGRRVRVEYSTGHRPAAYSCEIWMYDDVTGETVGRGNGDRSMAEAIMIYQWGNALSDLGLR